MEKIAIIGSTNVDLVMNVEHLPSPGETVGGGAFSQHYGGKGANQAIAAKRAGAEALFLTSVGKDAFGDNLKAYFTKEGFPQHGILQSEKQPTGTALIFVDRKAENCIGVAPGANGLLTKEVIQSWEDEIMVAGIILLQLEIPKSTVEYSIKTYGGKGKKIIMNPAPAGTLNKDCYPLIDTLIVNETEAETISGKKLQKNGEVEKAILELGVKNLIITKGSKGCVYVSEDHTETIAGYAVKAIDTVAAGDVFCGAYAAGLAQGWTIRNSIQFASAAAAISVTRKGAQSSIPTLLEIESFMQFND